MIAVIFEVKPAPGQQPVYLEHAAALKATLQGIDGFISVERFASLSEDGKLVSLSFWRDEDAVRAWRNTLAHRGAQRAGRDSIFAEYRLRVCQVLRDYGLHERDEAPPDSRALLG